MPFKQELEAELAALKQRYNADMQASRADYLYVLHLLVPYLAAERDGLRERVNAEARESNEEDREGRNGD